MDLNMAKDSPQAKYSEQNILNNVYDQTNRTLAVEGYGYDGVNIQRSSAGNMAVKITTVGTATYVGQAAPGTAEATAKWQVLKYDSGRVYWADLSNFSQAVTDMTGLDYA